MVGTKSNTDAQGRVTFYTVLLYLNGDGDAASINDSAAASAGEEAGGARTGKRKKTKGKRASNEGAPTANEGAAAASVDGESLPFVRGGATKFYTEAPIELACQFTPQAGCVLIHSHGHNCLLHEGAVVNDGTKYLLRTDVVYS